MRIYRSPPTIVKADLIAKQPGSLTGDQPTEWGSELLATPRLRHHCRHTTQKKPSILSDQGLLDKGWQ